MNTNVPDDVSNSQSPSSATIDLDLAMIAEEMFASGSAHHGAVLRILAVADRCRVDPVPLLQGLADESPAFYRQKLDYLAEQIRQGVALSKALIQVPELFTPSCQLGLQLARQSNAVSDLNAALLNRPPAWEPFELPGSHESLFSKNVRLFFRAFFMFSVILFIAVKILPELQVIMDEFEIEMPSSMLLLLHLTDQFYIFGLLFPLIGLFLLALFGIPALVRFVRHCNPFSATHMTLNRSLNRRHCLAMTRQTGQPIAESLELIRRIPALEKLFGGLQSMKTHFEREEPIWEALAADKIISQHESKALTCSQSGETQAWILRQSAADQQHHRETRRAVCGRVFMTILNVSLGLLVLLICFAIMMTLINVINELVDDTIRPR